MNLLQDKTLFITGASRGIGKAIALRAAREGANIAIAAKSTEENPKLGGTIYSAAEEIEAAGGKALPLVCDVRFIDQVNAAVAKAAETFGGIDILINNVSAISLTPVEKTEPSRFDLMHNINVRGTFFVSQACIPHLKNGSNPHILTLSPPINNDPKWLKSHVAYTIGKYNMTMIALGLAGELQKYGIASNTLWPKTTIATAAVRNLLGGEVLANKSRTADIVADAAAIILSRDAKENSGNNYIDEDVLREEGVSDFEKYSVVPGADLYPDLFL